MDLQDVVWGGMDWIDMAQDRDRWRVLVNAAMNIWAPKNVENLFDQLRICYLLRKDSAPSSYSFILRT
jgi:hypothetical protein